MFSASPTRAAGLQDVLVKRPRPAAPVEAEEEPQVDLTARPEEAAPPQPTARKPRTRAPRPEQQPAQEPGRLMVVYVTQEDLQWVAARRKATDLTNAQIVLSAVEAAAARLPDAFRAAATPPRTGMFAATAAKAPKAAQRHVQLGMNGVPASDRRVLDQLVADVGAGSLSALVRAALQLAQVGTGE